MKPARSSIGASPGLMPWSPITSDGMTKMIRTLIVDDESLARQRIANLLSRHAGFDIVAQCADADDARKQVDDLAPDLMFLDVQMPGLTGLDLMYTARFSKPPCTVFVTAHEGYALDAFKIGALDYLLKPIDNDRFQATLVRILSHMHKESRAREQMAIGLAMREQGGRQMIGTTGVADRIPVKMGRKVRFINVGQILYVTANKDHARLHMRNGEVIGTTDRITKMDEVLRMHPFVRVHRSIIICLTAVREVNTLGSYYEFVMADGSRLESGTTYKQTLANLFAHWQKPSAQVV